ncbi:hypothetical protein RFM98_28760 [Mesorhizobium sp. VK9D]|nr:hypothetical protein [Mesorhizobium sp. VK9D]
MLTEPYDLVWSKPMTEIARQYGIRGQHVAQTCDAYEIAQPRAGHWRSRAQACEAVANG